MKTYTFHVFGTHCASCKIFIEDVLNEQSFVKNARVDLKKETVEIETDSDQSPEALAQMLTEKIKSHGYRLSVDGFDKLTITLNFRLTVLISQCSSPSAQCIFIIHTSSFFSQYPSLISQCSFLTTSS
jgi:cation transport ATPase